MSLGCMHCPQPIHGLVLLLVQAVSNFQRTKLFVSSDQRTCCQLVECLPDLQIQEQQKQQQASSFA